MARLFHVLQIGRGGGLRSRSASCWFDFVIILLYHVTHAMTFSDVVWSLQLLCYIAHCKRIMTLIVLIYFRKHAKYVCSFEHNIAHGIKTISCGRQGPICPAYSMERLLMTRRKARNAENVSIWWRHLWRFLNMKIFPCSMSSCMSYLRKQGSETFERPPTWRQTLVIMILQTDVDSKC